MGETQVSIFMFLFNFFNIVVVRGVEMIAVPGTETIKETGMFKLNPGVMKSHNMSNCKAAFVQYWLECHGSPTAVSRYVVAFEIKFII